MPLTNATSRLTPSAHSTAVLARPTFNTVFWKGVMRALGGLAPTADPYAGSAEASDGCERRLASSDASAAAAPKSSPPGRRAEAARGSPESSNG